MFVKKYLSFVCFYKYFQEVVFCFIQTSTAALKAARLRTEEALLVDLIQRT